MNIKDAIDAFEKARVALNDAIRPRLTALAATRDFHYLDGMEIQSPIGDRYTDLFNPSYEHGDYGGEGGVETKYLMMSDEEFCTWIAEERARADNDEFEYAQAAVERLQRDLESARNNFEKLKEMRNK